MKNYEVTLSRLVEQKVHVTVSVTARGEAEAKRLAIRKAKSDSVDWSSDIADPPDYGEITVELIEEIVDFDDPV